MLVELLANWNLLGLATTATAELASAASWEEPVAWSSFPWDMYRWSKMEATTAGSRPQLL